jgi:DNA repair exonuclease SbcCD ATPase subunit
VSDFSGGQLGELNQGDTAGGNIYHISASIDALIELLQNNLEQTNQRVQRLEEIESLHAQERQSLTRALMMLANESTSVRDVQRQLDEQIASERHERTDRRRYLDRVLYALIALNAAGIGIRLLRRPNETNECLTPFRPDGRT